MPTYADILRDLENAIRGAVADRAGLDVESIDYEFADSADEFPDEVIVKIALRYSPEKVTGRQAMDVTNAVFETIRSERGDIYPIVRSHFHDNQEIASF